MIHHRSQSYVIQKAFFRTLQQYVVDFRFLAEKNEDSLASLNVDFLCDFQKFWKNDIVLPLDAGRWLTWVFDGARKVLVVHSAYEGK